MHATDYVLGYNFNLFKATLEDLLLERSQRCLLIQCVLVGGQQVKMAQRRFSLGESVFLPRATQWPCAQQNKAKTSRAVTQIVYPKKFDPSTFCLDEQLQMKKTNKQTSGSEGIVIVELWFHLAGLGMPARLHLLCISFPESDCSVDCAQMEGRHGERKWAMAKVSIALLRGSIPKEVSSK